jgi:hypothetical protein
LPEAKLRIELHCVRRALCRRPADSRQNRLWGESEPRPRHPGNFVAGARW